MVTTKKINSACLVIIGNEILSGRTQDKNINHIAKELFICGISLQLVVVIPDQKKIIISQIRKLKNQYDFIITTGGIGPTHDDITSELTDARMKMAYMPEGSKLILNKVSGAPGFKIENIYVFAGIPLIVQAMMKEFKKMIKIKNKFYSTTISTKLFESKIAHLLVQAERKYKNISIGSYPIFDGKPKGVEIVINSQVNKLGVSNAKKFILREINKII